MPPLPSPESFLALLGDFPELPPTEPRVLAVEEVEDHTRTLLEYAGLDDEPITAFLLTPRHRAGKLPGVLAIHQDGAHRPYEFGKSEPAGVAGDPELAYGLELCRRGYVVLCPDRFGFESRRLARSRFAPTFAGFRLFAEGGLELTEDLYKGAMANRLLLEGRSALGQELFELRRGVDVLAARPEVDAGHLGTIGHSAGGLLTALLMYVDQRVKIGCASCGTFLFRWWFNQVYLRPINGFAGLGTVPGLLRWGDVDDILAGLAPRPYLETGDPEETSERTAALTGKARDRYAALGVAERFEWVGYDSGHTFRRDMRERSYAWFDRWLPGGPSS